MKTALFVTCLVDTMAPRVGVATVEVLERLGVDVAFPREQTCCGQMHLNAGYPKEVERLGRRFVEVFSGFETIVAPSGSCAAHVRHHVPEIGSRVFELTEFLVRKLGVEDVGARFAGAITYHPACHSLRLLRIGDAPDRLLASVDGARIVPLPDAAECCGFGGTFAVKNPVVSSGLLEEKIANVEATGADVVCACDSSCLMHIGGGLRRRGSRVRALHVAEILAGTA